MTGELEIRKATDADLPAVLALLRDAMGRSDDERFEALFRWKHLENAFGPSPAWVAVDGDRIAAVRYLMRWSFERGSRTLHAVRAVDTATHPDYQGMRLFTKLTLGALDALRSEGVDFVFNTPNDQSRPGYLKMGWSVVGRLPVPSRPLSLRGAVRMAKARVPAQHFSSESTVGAPASEVLADDVTVGALLAARLPTTRLRTALSLAMLRWRYGGDLLRYRAVVAASGPRDGIAIVRVRCRGGARELAVGLVLAPDSGRARSVVRQAMRAARSEADYAIAIGERPGPYFAPIPRAGPTLTWRAVATDEAMPPPDDWLLTLGDIELF
ncbi:MAG TPA: GNAT family N-acetyltransferase [Acidimicrobiia bacterium]|jgi:predicted N-acetyltransferase YhbS